MHAASVQFVRKISGFARPSQENAEAFERAIEEVARASRELLDSLYTSAPTKDRETERSKARARAEKRFGGARSA